MVRHKESHAKTPRRAETRRRRIEPGIYEAPGGGLEIRLDEMLRFSGFPVTRRNVALARKAIRELVRDLGRGERN